jgi:MoaA/NifB/PqqE/SkfB family radical SAM enzyme
VDQHAEGVEAIVTLLGRLEGGPSGTAGENQYKRRSGDEGEESADGRASLARQRHWRTPVVTLSGLHLLLTYGCTYECDHCFVWSGPRQCGTFTIAQIEDVLQQARTLGTVEWFYFEGGEPFLYHAPLRWGVRRAAELGFQVGIVSNAYWAVDVADAVEWLRDFAGLVQDLSVSCDKFHGETEQERRVENARRAARELGIPVDVIRIAPAEESGVAPAVGQLPPGETGVMFRGRAAEKLTDQAPRIPWATFTKCPYEDLREPGRVHVDPLGYVHVCQGIAIGNLFRTPLREICRDYRPDVHPVVGPLLAGGPAQLARQYDVAHEEGYADACHLCYRVRDTLRPRFAEILAPDQMYGTVESA